MIEQLKFLIADLKTWRCKSVKHSFYLITEQAIWGTIFYRLSRTLFCVDIPILKILFRLMGYILFKFSETFLGVAIRPGTDIGPGLHIGHAGCIMINEQVKIGKNFCIAPGVLLGTRGGGHEGTPIVGDNVFIGSGGKVLGNVRIGNNVKIGANSVVLEDVPDNVAVFGVPARIIGPVFKKR